MSRYTYIAYEQANGRWQLGGDEGDVVADDLTEAEAKSWEFTGNSLARGLQVIAVNPETGEWDVYDGPTAPVDDDPRDDSPNDAR